METLIFATNNKNKVDEVKAVLLKHDFNITTLLESPCWTL